MIFFKNVVQMVLTCRADPRDNPLACFSLFSMFERILADSSLFKRVEAGFSKKSGRKKLFTQTREGAPSLVHRVKIGLVLELSID